MDNKVKEIVKKKHYADDHVSFSNFTQLSTSAAYTFKPCTIRSTKCKKIKPMNKGS